MAQFPLDTSHILTLAENMVTGFAENDTVFSGPPIPSNDLDALREAAVAAYDAQIAAQAAAKAATEAKNAAFAALTDAMKDDLSYAEHAAASPADLSLIGWGPRAVSTPLASPGQPGSLEIPRQDAGMVRLAWKKPRDGGKPAFYKAEVRTVDPAGDWDLQGTATATKLEISGLQQAVQLEFRIIAENSAGSGPPSNTVSAVL